MDRPLLENFEPSSWRISARLTVKILLFGWRSLIVIPGIFYPLVLAWFFSRFSSTSDKARSSNYLEVIDLETVLMWRCWTFRIHVV
ncbi:MAG: hypothetical protein MGF17_00345 [Trichodesmium sp. MAG_R04]|nr:hypothetical protein [Trichodesmium sp. MAG_R04]